MTDELRDSDEMKMIVLKDLIKLAGENKFIKNDLRFKMQFIQFLIQNILSKVILKLIWEVITL